MGFIQDVLSMYRNAMIEINNDEQYGFLQVNNSVEEEQEELSIPKTELQFLDILSELVSFLPNIKLREQILIEIENTITTMNIQLENNKSKNKNNSKALPIIN